MNADRRPAALWALFTLQALCAAFFVWDVIVELLGLDNERSLTESDRFEYLIVTALVFSLAFTGRHLHTLMTRQKRMENQLKVAAGAFAELLEDHFDAWALTPSERDVALLAIKGLSIADMARLRETKEGTVKAQCNAIYRKAGVSGRPQLLSLFIEELMADGIAPV